MENKHSNKHNVDTNYFIKKAQKLLGNNEVKSVNSEHMDSEELKKIRLENAVKRAREILGENYTPPSLTDEEKKIRLENAKKRVKKILETSKESDLRFKRTVQITADSVIVKKVMKQIYGSRSCCNCRCHCRCR